MATILLVDDEVALQYVLGKLLSNAGHKVFTAANGIEAEKMFIQHAPDLIITDLIMPDREGLGLITVLRRKHPFVPIIAMSAGGRGNSGLYLTMAKFLGATYTLSKPFTGTQLLKVVESVLLTSPSACPPACISSRQFAEQP